MQTAPSPRLWSRPSTWRLLAFLRHDPPWWYFFACGALGIVLAIVLPDPPRRPPRLDVVTYQAAQARQEALLQEIRAALRHIREALDQRR